MAEVVSNLDRAPFRVIAGMKPPRRCPACGGSWPCAHHRGIAAEPWNAAEEAPHADGPATRTEGPRRRQARGGRGRPVEGQRPPGCQEPDQAAPD